MTEKLKQLIEQEIARIPPEGQEIIAASDWVRITREIGEKFLLNEEEVLNLQIETLLALIGTTDLQSYTVNIENQVGTTTETANKISNEVFEKIFRPINEKLTERIKNSEKIHTAGAEQNLDFILSGGDYFAFLKDQEQKEAEEQEESGDRKINVKII
jgi:hypothetical protein